MRLREAVVLGDVEVAAAVSFEGAATSWVHRFKYPPPGLAALDPAPTAVARWLVLEALDRLPGPPPDEVVPVPLHPRALRRRGFNPSTTLATAVAKATGARLRVRALARARETRSQTGLDRLARRANVAGAFRLGRAPTPAARICLVDDVVTTGATLSECARVLRDGGAGEVAAVCVARTL